MQVARLWNQGGSYCREWQGKALNTRFPDLGKGGLSLSSPQFSPNVCELIDGEKLLAVLVLNGHSLVIEEAPEEILPCELRP